MNISGVISCPPGDVYELYCDIKDANEMLELARNDAYGVVIYIGQTYNAPEFIVEIDEEPVYSENYCDCEDDIEVAVWCREMAMKLYDTCLSAYVLDLLDGDISLEDEEERNIDTEIEDREFELDDTFDTVLYMALRDSGVSLSLDDEEKIKDDLKEKCLEYLARKYKIPIWRPMYLVGEDGEEFIEEYPYEHMIFDEKDVNKIL